MLGGDATWGGAGLRTEVSGNVKFEPREAADRKNRTDGEEEAEQAADARRALSGTSESSLIFVWRK